MYKGQQSGVKKYALADVEVAREADFGTNDGTFRCVSHLGHLLNVGDVVLGYDIQSTVLTSEVEWSMDNEFTSSFVLPDIVLVRKVKGGGGNAELSSEDTSAAKGNTGKAKASASRKRERRMKKEEKKQKKLEAAASRMGLDTDQDVHLDFDDFDEERIDDGGELFAQTVKTKYDSQLVEDDLLAEDLGIVEKELAQQMEKLKTTESDVVTDTIGENKE